jgi:hypothetical protein
MVVAARGEGGGSREDERDGGSRLPEGGAQALEGSIGVSSTAALVTDYVGDTI